MERGRPKKLIEVATALAGGGRKLVKAGPQEVEQIISAVRFDAASAERFRQFHGVRVDLDKVDVWEPHVPAFQAFVVAMSQTRMVAVAGIGGGSLLVPGLDYGSAKVAWDAHGIDLDRELMQQIQVMESAYCQALQGD